MRTTLVRALGCAALLGASTVASGASTGAFATLFDEDPLEGLVNFETPHVHPLDRTPDGRLLLAVNTALGALEVFAIDGGDLKLVETVPVGLDPASVRARTATEAWVVNQVSDSISIVDLTRLTVAWTLETANEPADVIFAGDPERAFVSCSAVNSVQVFDPADLTLPPTSIEIAAEEPRALARSSDGLEVYVAIFESGNGTTALNGRLGPVGSGEGLGANDVVSRPEGPYGGQNPAPNSGAGFDPPKNPANGTPPPQSIIVREDAQGAWMDDNSGDWSIFVDGSLAALSRRLPGWELVDRDVAVIDAQTLAVSYQPRLMNLVMALDVNPATGEVTAVGTEATNEVRFEPNLTGTFVRVHMASFLPGFGSQITDLNPHLDYTTGNIPVAQRELSVGDPRGVRWRSDGARAFVTGMGSNNVVEIDAMGQRMRTVDVGRGPTGVVLDEPGDRVYVLNRFSGSISTVGLTAGQELARTKFFDPTPKAIKAGRKFLYDTHLTSGLGQVSCASCHVDARTDRLGWDLGNPAAGSGFVHPMKGPLLTQSLQDIIRHPKMHWRGDREDLFAFNPAFVSLMGADAEFSNAKMAKFEAFLDTIHFPPNPFRNLDNTRPSQLLLPDGRTGNIGTALDSCQTCHLGGQSRADGLVPELSQQFIPPTFHGMYDRIGYWPDGPVESVSGFGYFHDGVDPLFVATRGVDFTAEMLTIDGPGVLTGPEARKDVHAAVGQQVTVDGAPTPEQVAQLNRFRSIASADPHVALIAKGRFGGVQRGFYFTGVEYQADRVGRTVSHDALLGHASAGRPVTFTMVAEGTEVRLGVDRDFDGVFDGDEQEILRVKVRISAGIDDAEEDALGVMDLVSDELELVLGPSGAQHVGLRFLKLRVPRGAEIISATVQFEVAERTLGATSLSIRAHDVGDAPEFSAGVPLSTLPLTTASATWDVAPWTATGLAGPDQRSVDLREVVQEVVDRSDWYAKRALALIVTGSGLRIAESFEGSPSGAAVLRVEYYARGNGVPPIK